MSYDPEGSRSPEAVEATCFVGQGRVELPTSRLSGVRSNHLSYWPGSSTHSLRRVGAFARLPMIVCKSTHTHLGPWKLVRTCHDLSRLDPFQKPLESGLLRKEVIQPQVPLRLPCYDFTPVTIHSLGTCLPFGLAQPLLEQMTPMV
jgi:hypothetical protein